MTVNELKAAKRLPMPEYTNPAIASAVARIRREGEGLYRVIAKRPSDEGHFGYDLPYHDAAMMERELKSNRYKDVEMFKIS